MKTKTHRYDPDPRSTSVTPTCKCGMTKAHRSHQPWWWRAFYWEVQWR